MTDTRRANKLIMNRKWNKESLSDEENSSRPNLYNDFIHSSSNKRRNRFRKLKRRLSGNYGRDCVSAVPINFMKDKKIKKSSVFLNKSVGLWNKTLNNSLVSYAGYGNYGRDCVSAVPINFMKDKKIKKSSVFLNKSVGLWNKTLNNSLVSYAGYDRMSHNSILKKERGFQEEEKVYRIDNPKGGKFHQLTGINGETCAELLGACLQDCYKLIVRVNEGKIRRNHDLPTYMVGVLQMYTGLFREQNEYMLDLIRISERDMENLQLRGALMDSVVRVVNELLEVPRTKEPRSGEYFEYTLATIISLVGGWFYGIYPIETLRKVFDVMKQEYEIIEAARLLSPIDEEED